MILPSLSIVIPAFNEEGSIEATIHDALDVGTQVAGEHLEVLICNDGSRDDTSVIAHMRADSDDDGRVVVLDRGNNAGIEASMRALYARAQHEWVFLMSADRQWPMASLVPMAEAAAAGADFVIGVRPNKREVYTRYRRVISWGYERVVRSLGAPGGDPGSIKLARRELLDQAVAARGVFAEGERVIRAARSGARVVEVPVEFEPRRSGKATGARTKIVARALTDAVRVTSSLVLGWPRPEKPESDV